MNIFETIELSTTLPDKYQKMSRKEMENQVRTIKEKLGNKLLIPGHHYQKDEIIQFADATGDSLKLAQISADNKEAEYIVFCGVHFMAETADILTEDTQKVFLPDMRAGCSMADMADVHQTEQAWAILSELFGDTIIPLTYVNSTAAIKAFVGEHGGATVTSSNALAMVEWALQQKQRILFLPDQHLGRNTAYELGIKLEEMAIWDPTKQELEYTGDIQALKVILWKGHCSVHENFTVKNIEETRHEFPDMKIIVHPECSREVVEMSDFNGSTSYIIEMIERSPAGSSWAIGTEMNLVNRLIKTHPDKKIISLNQHMCPCLTMNRIDLPHLLWCLDNIVEGIEHQLIKVDSRIAKNAVLALDAMLERA